MKMIAVLFLALVPYVNAFAVNAEGKSEVGLYFEPTQADADCCHVQITAQQNEYIAAKNKGDYIETRRLALFHFTRAWAWFNEAMSIAQSEEGWMNVTELKKAQGLVANAIADLEQAKLKGHHMSSVKVCEALCLSNQVRIDEQITALLK